MREVTCVGVKLGDLRKDLEEKISHGDRLFKWTTIIEDVVEDEPFQNMELLSVLPVRYVNGELDEALLLFVPQAKE